MVTRAVTSLVLGMLAGGAMAQSAPATQPASEPAVQVGRTAPAAPAGSTDIGKLAEGLPEIAGGGKIGPAVQWIAVITLLSVAPAVLVLVTCFTRIIVVLGLLRQALATQQVPPNQVLFGLALLMTLVVMAPVYQQVYTDAVQPYMDGRVSGQQAAAAGEAHVRQFMIRQIEAGGNTDDVYLFLKADAAKRDDLQWGDVPTVSLIPAFVVSELKVSFLMGFRIYLPFLIVDMLVGTVLVSMGMLMLPPVMISLPFKLLLFVLADGWHLVVGTLMRSFG
jgi:flagellar biosynthetic protein FliP